MARPATVRELKRQSGGRRRDRDQVVSSDGDLTNPTTELRPSWSESELTDLPDLRFNTRSQSVRHSTGFSSQSAELPFRPKAATVPSYATLRHSHVDLRDSKSGQQPSALERLYSTVLPRHSAEEQLQQMKEQQRSLKRQRKRSIGTASASQSPVSRARGLPPLPKPSSNALASRLPSVPNHHHDAPVQRPSYHNLRQRPTDPGEVCHHAICDT
uniref:pleckstrin homology domain-containing family A member 7-like n=1 Tax=Myxine glutinosa TaxID=7769 RepID=UPI00358FF7C1